jgi:hypothetical protein
MLALGARRVDHLIFDTATVRPAASRIIWRTT